METLRPAKGMLLVKDLKFLGANEVFESNHIDRSLTGRDGRRNCELSICACTDSDAARAPRRSPCILCRVVG